MRFGHGWIAGKDGKRWHPCHSQEELLATLSTTERGRNLCDRNYVVSFTNSITKVGITPFMKKRLRAAIRLYWQMVVTFSR
ncbi:phage filamentation protein Fil family protein [Klebsiella sp. JB_Kp018]|uniref:phage filamentation protein Fil family protein n=1 Tax=Klebsiella TaxID=570 RepID=UPI002FCD8174